MTTPADLMHAEAACSDADDATFFPLGRDPALALPAKVYCRRCPLIRACLSYALEHDVDGIWGGTTPAERTEIRRRHHINPVQLDLDPYIRSATQEAAV